MSSISIPRKESGTVTKKTILKVGSKSLLLTIHENAFSIMLYIGGHDLYCVNVFLSKSDNLISGDLVHIYYNVNCSLEHNFQRGIDTNMIICLLMSYISRMYPLIETLKFNDASFRVCDNKYIVELPQMNYITSGKTWYEKHFGVYLDTKEKERFLEYERKFQAAKKTTSWAYFRSFITSELPFSEEEAEKLYDSVDSWQEFFRPVLDKIGISQFCIFVSPWLNTFFLKFFKKSFVSFDYLMPITNSVKFTETQYVHGGQRFTRKVIYKRPQDDGR